MKRHAYAYWGVGHMSHPEDPTGCCGQAESAPIHLCGSGIGDGHPRDWLYCNRPFGHPGDCEAAA